MLLPLAQEQDAGDVLDFTTRMQQGDEAAFNQFYQCYCDRLFRYLLVVSQGRETMAREALQNVMLKVVRSIEPFASEPQLWAWLTTIARHAYIDLYRKEKSSLQTVPFSESLLPEFETGFEKTFDEQLLRLLEETLRLLEPHEQRLVEDFYYHRASYQSLARALNTTPKAVESKLARTRQKLRQFLKGKLRNERLRP